MWLYDPINLPPEAGNSLRASGNSLAEGEILSAEQKFSPGKAGIKTHNNLPAQPGNLLPPEGGKKNYHLPKFAFFVFRLAVSIRWMRFLL